MTPRPNPTDTRARATEWRVIRDRAPFALPAPGDVLGTIVAPDREQARRAAERLYPAEATVVVHASAWRLEPADTEALNPRKRPSLWAPRWSRR